MAGVFGEEFAARVLLLGAAAGAEVDDAFDDDAFDDDALDDDDDPPPALEEDGAGAGAAACGGVTMLCTMCVAWGTAFSKPFTVSPIGSCPDPRLVSGKARRTATPATKAVNPRRNTINLPARIDRRQGFPAPLPCR
jgi:hypothetical protein